MDVRTNVRSRIPYACIHAHMYQRLRACVSAMTKVQGIHLALVMTNCRYDDDEPKDVMATSVKLKDVPKP